MSGTVLLKYILFQVNFRKRSKCNLFNGIQLLEAINMNIENLSSLCQVVFQFSLKRNLLTNCFETTKNEFNIRSSKF